MFIVDGIQKKEPIPEMPGLFRYSLDNLKTEIKNINSFSYLQKDFESEIFRHNKILNDLKKEWVSWPGILAKLTKTLI